MSALRDRAYRVLGWHTRQAGDIYMTNVHFMVLRQLAEAGATGYPFQPLRIDPRSIRYMISNDWIMESVSKIDGGTAYRITGRGEKALRRLSVPCRRSDGLCPRCGEHPRFVRRNGKIAPYCKLCDSLKGGRNWSLGLRNPPGLCSRCKIHPRHITPSGNVRSYCKQCRRANSRREKEQQNARNLARIAAGEVLLCYICHAQPREIANGIVRDYCPDCRRAYLREYSRRKS